MKAINFLFLSLSLIAAPAHAKDKFSAENNCYNALAIAHQTNNDLSNSAILVPNDNSSAGFYLFMASMPYFCRPTSAGITNGTIKLHYMKVQLPFKPTVFIKYGEPADATGVATFEEAEPPQKTTQETFEPAICTEHLDTNSNALFDGELAKIIENIPSTIAAKSDVRAAIETCSKIPAVQKLLQEHAKQKAAQPPKPEPELGPAI